MRTIFLLLAFLVLFVSASAQERDPGNPYLLLPPSEISRIQDVIGAQVAAFRADDMETAFSFAAPGIQQTFRDPDAFGTMVERRYGPIFDTFAYEFLEVLGTMGAPVQVVSFIGEDLTSVIAFYLMEMQPEGVWRISGVQIVPGEQQPI